MEGILGGETRFVKEYPGEEEPKQRVEIPNPDLEKERKELSNLVERDFGWLKSKLKPEDYERFIGQLVEQEEADNENLEFVNSELEDSFSFIKEFEDLMEMKIKELNLAKIDTTTGMSLRRYLFSEAIPKELFKAEGIRVEEITDEKWLELLLDEESILNKISLTISTIDLSYLNLANREGHIHGDNLLEALGALAKKNEEIKKNAHRIGGDEFAFLFKDREEAGDKMEKLKKDFSEQGELANLAKYGLEPNLDVGEASFSEAVGSFRELLKTKVGKERIEKDKVFKEFCTVWLMLADKRSLLDKAQTRIPILMDHYELGFDEEKIIDEYYAKEYELLIKYLGKGAYEIDKKEIIDLIKKSKGDNYKTNELVWEYIFEKEQGKLSKDSPEEYEALRDWVIARKLGFLDENYNKFKVNQD